jgi:hypothetical protein
MGRESAHHELGEIVDRFEIDRITEAVERMRSESTLIMRRLPDGTKWSHLDGVRGVKSIARSECGIILTDEQAEEVCAANGWRKYPA